MAEDKRFTTDRALSGAVWAAAGLVGLLLIYVGYLLYKHEASTNTLVKRQLDAAQRFEGSDRESPLPNIARGELYYREGKPDQAETEFKIALEKEPTNARALVHLGILYSEQRKYQEAEQRFLEVVRQRRSDQFAQIDAYLAEARYQLGLIRTAKSKRGEAVKQFNEALTITPTDADAHYALGHCYLVLKDYKRAVASLERALSFDPAFAEALYDLGQTYEGLGNDEEAVATYNRAVMADATFTDAAQALERLSKKSPASRRSESGQGGESR